MKRNFFFIFSIFLAFSSCNEKVEKQPEVNTNMEITSEENLDTEIGVTGATQQLDGTWLLESFNKETVENTDAYIIPTLEINAENGAVTGNAGCNKYEGKISMGAAENFQITAEKVSEVSCPETSLEPQFLRALTAQGMAYKFNEEQLIFYNNDNTLVFSRSK